MAVGDAGSLSDVFQAEKCGWAFWNIPAVALLFGAADTPDAAKEATVRAEVKRIFLTGESLYHQGWGDQAKSGGIRRALVPYLYLQGRKACP